MEDFIVLFQKKQTAIVNEIFINIKNNLWPNYNITSLLF